MSNLAIKIIPNLRKDDEELREKGYTIASYSKELAAIIETMFIELYSSVDCTRQILSAIYRKYDGITSKSTRKLFANANSDKIDNRVPKEIRKTLKESMWYHNLMKIRDSLIHSNTGFCYKDRNDVINYIHPDLGTPEKAFVIKGVFIELYKYRDEINKFLGTIFHELNQTLNSVEVTQVCGIFRGRVYERKVAFTYNLNFSSGRCLSFIWFLRENEKKYVCPFKNECGAFLNRENWLCKIPVNGIKNC